jgi:hypothetical protein
MQAVLDNRSPISPTVPSLMEFLLFNQEKYNHFVYNFGLVEGIRDGKRIEGLLLS